MKTAKITQLADITEKVQFYDSIYGYRENDDGQEPGYEKII